MMFSFKSCWISVYSRAEAFLHVSRCKRIKRNRHHHRISSGLDLITASFSAMEVSGQFKQVFKAIDANGDGKISALELSELLLCLGYEYEETTATKEAEGMVREMDCNGDGLIDLEEFMQAVVTTDGEICSNGQEDDHLVLRDAFLIFDADKNGLISAMELRRVLISLGFDCCSLQDCRQMIKGVDKNGDGFVDFEEFRSMMAVGTS